MNEKRDQDNIAQKFALNWHLDVKDRQELHNGVLVGSLVCNEIVKILDSGGWYPSKWRPENDFSGGLIQKLESGCRIHWKAESGVMRYDLIEVVDFDSVESGVLSFAKRFFGNVFDGIEIDWSR